MKTIRVLQFISPTGFYGAERWILALNNNLDPDLVKSDILVTGDSRQGKDVIQHFQSENHEAIELRMKSRFSMTAIRDLAKIIRILRIDIIHTHGYKTEILGLIAARLTGIKTLSTPHGFGQPKDWKLKLYVWLGKASLRFFDCVAPLSQQLVDEVQTMRIPRTRIAYIRNAVDVNEIDQAKLRQERPRTINRYRIGFIGQMIPRKNVEHILYIFNQIWLENKNVELVLLGDGESRESLENNARKLPSFASIKFLGFRDDRLDLLSQFDLFVMTASDEGIPRCLMEAMAMRIPVAAYRIPGIDQLVVHESSGLLADFGDKDMLKTYWKRLLFDREYAQDLANEGLRMIENNFSAKRMADEYTSLYESMLTQPDI